MELIACLVWSYATTKASGIATNSAPERGFASPITRMHDPTRASGRLNASA